MSLLDELKAKQKSDPDPGVVALREWDRLHLDENAQAVYEKMQELHPGERIEVEHWTVMRVYNEHGLCIDVRRSINA
jgi:hypothetical protein